MSIGWHQTISLLKAGDYQQAAASLDRARQHYEEHDEALWAATLTVTQRLCLMCVECAAASAHHQQALIALSEQLDKLNADLLAIITLLQNLETREEADPLAGAGPRSRSREVQQTLWRRLGSVLGRARLPAPQPAPAAELPPMPASPISAQPSAALAVCCLGPFRVYQHDRLVEDWASRKGKLVFKYLVTHRERPIPKEVLMDLFWPDSSPDAARNNLNVAIYGLRQSLHQNSPDESHILYQDDCYLINPDLDIWVDVEAFRDHLARARRLDENSPAGAIPEYHLAEALYTGDFLDEDRYEDWASAPRQQLKDAYLDVLERLSRHYYMRGEYATCIAQCRKALAVDSCRESAHRWIMQCYAQQGQRYLAIRQYQECADALQDELGVEPSGETVKLYERILTGDQTRPDASPQPVFEFQGI